MVIPAAARSPSSAARSGLPGMNQHGTSGDILVRSHQPGSGGDRSGHLDRALHRLRRVLDHHDGVRAIGDHGAGRDRHARAGCNRDARGGAHAHRAGEGEVRGQSFGGAVRVGGAHGESVDGRPGEAGQGVGRRHVDCDDPSQCLLQRNGFDVRPS